MRNLGVIIILCIVLGLQAQQVGIGQWRDHFPYKNCIAVEDAGDIVYAATYYAVFSFNKTDNSVERISKINGLSDIGIQEIVYHQASQCLLVAYRNTNLDLIKEDGIINLTDIKRKQDVENKSINHVFLDGNYAYLACGFGIVVLDLVREEIKDTYYIGENASVVNVLDITKNDTAFFAATEEGIYSANVNSPNLADFNYWQKQTNVPYQDMSYNLTTVFSGKVFFNRNNTGFNNDSLFYWDGAEWNKLEDDFPSDIQALEVSGGALLVSRNEDVLVYQPNLNLDYRIWNPSQLAVSASDAQADANGNIWIADTKLGLVKTFDEGNSAETISLQSPDFADVFAMDAQGEQLWLVSGGYDKDFNPEENSNGFASFVDESWSSYYCQSLDCNWPDLLNVQDFVDVEINPNDAANVFLSCWGSGVIEIQDGQIATVFNAGNSSLEGSPEILVGGVMFDGLNNLWVVNSGAENILSVKTSDNQWISFNLGSSNTNITADKLFVDSYNQKWIIPDRSQSLIVFSENGTLENTSDDLVKNLSSLSGNGALTSDQINCMAQDFDDEIWLGTSEGIGVIYAPYSVFGGGNFDMERILVKWEGNVQYLLETENITTITVDQANRKWIGTKQSGVFLLSEDGSEQIHHFTTENSPLISNRITDIAIRDDGEVFIGTDLGLVSYRGMAASSSNSGSNVYAFPNPVPAGYTGSIAIKNLYQDANVKITDITGNVVYETRALGGQTIWDGHNFSGRKAHTGVYLVFSSNEDGSVSLVTKILFVN